MTRVLFLFLDGVGIGPADPDVNPFLRARLPVLSEARARRDHVRDFVERFGAAYRAELVDFVSKVRNGTVVGANGWDAMAAFTLAQACDRSFRTGQTVKLTHSKDGERISYSFAADADTSKDRNK